MLNNTKSAEGGLVMKWYGDNSELYGMDEAKIPDILIFGGIMVSPEAEKKIHATVEGIKLYYGCLRYPIKWNFKDLKKLYKKKGKMKAYDILLNNSKEWREKVFDCLADTDCKLVVSVLETHSKRREMVKAKKDELCGYCFCDGLQRFAMEVKALSPGWATVILDWPDKSKSYPFDREYAFAYARGTNTAGKEYYSGMLSRLGFSDSVLFTNMEYSTLLQVADLVTGMTREMVECAIGKKDDGFGVDMFKKVKNRFRGAPKQIIGRGISVHSERTDLRRQIAEF